MAESIPSDAERDPHFIGWLPMPRAYARLLIPVTALVVAGLTVGAALLAWGQRSPGLGAWDDGTTTFVGVVYADPYAMVRVPPAEPGDPPRTVLLVDEGKRGAKERVRPLDGRPGRVSGTVLARGGRLMLELVTGDAGLRAAELPEVELAELRRGPPRSRGAVSLRGEIVDSKCYLGAMKPGGGRTHKGCAALCLRGGVPPLFVARRQGETAYLLANPDGGPLDARFFDLAGDSVLLDGVREDWDDLPVLKVAGATP